METPSLRTFTWSIFNKALNDNIRYIHNKTLIAFSPGAASFYIIISLYILMNPFILDFGVLTATVMRIGHIRHVE